MLIFPRGITGFDVPKGHPEADPRAFRADCWAVVAPRRGRVDDRPQVLAPRLVSFLAVVLVLSQGEVTAMLNKFHPWLGFCRPLEPGIGAPEFADPGRVGEAFAALGRYRVLPRDELDRLVEDHHCAEMGPAERKQLKYWSRLAGPGRLRVGDVIFNSWD